MRFKDLTFVDRNHKSERWPTERVMVFDDGNLVDEVNRHGPAHRALILAAELDRLDCDWSLGMASQDAKRDDCWDMARDLDAVQASLSKCFFDGEESCDQTKS